MKRLLLLTVIFLSGCIDVDMEMDADTPAVTPTETISLYVDNFNNADITLLNETTASPSFGLEERRGIFMTHMATLWILTGCEAMDGVIQK